MDEEILQTILDRFDIIENKLDQLNNDSLQLNDYFKIINGIPNGYTLIDSTRTN